MIIESLWIETALKDFGFKCMQGKPEECNDPKCASFYHKRNRDKEIFYLTQ